MSFFTVTGSIKEEICLLNTMDNGGSYFCYQSLVGAHLKY